MAISAQPEVVVHTEKADESSAAELRVVLGDTLAQKLLRWTTKSGLAILDQGLISGSNFAASILLARWLTPAQYGAYAVAFSVFILLSLIYLALLLEPMAVFGGSAYHNCLREYLRVLVKLQVGVAFLVVVPLGISALVAWKLAPASGLPGRAGRGHLGVALSVPLLVGPTDLLPSAVPVTEPCKEHSCIVASCWAVSGSRIARACFLRSALSS